MFSKAPDISGKSVFCLSSSQSQRSDVNCGSCEHETPRWSELKVCRGKSKACSPGL